MNVVDKLLLQAGLKPTLSTGHSLKTRVLSIGPGEAAALLVANRDNRTLRKGRVEFYAKTMIQGAWRLTHQGIAFCVDGRGLDLQHRLHAIIKSGVTVDMMVTEGLSPEAFDAIDQHERRTMADALRIDRALTESAKFFIALRGERGNTNPTVLELGEACALIEDDFQYLMSVCNSRRAVYSSVPVRAAAITLMHEKPKLREQIASNYKLLVLGHSEHWTRTLHTFNRQLISGTIDKGWTGRLDLCVRALTALDPGKSNLSRITVDEKSIAYARARVSALISTDSDDDENCLSRLHTLARKPIKDLTNSERAELRFLSGASA